MYRLTSHSGFSLVELLAVVAMIAVMTALLFPVLNKGKKNAQTAYDLNNNKQILMAAQMYAGENDDFLPQPGWGTQVACWAAGANIPLGGGAYALLDTYSAVLPKQLASFQKGQLFSYLKSSKLLRCPADNVLSDMLFHRSIYISSYVWNAAVIGFPTRTTKADPPLTFRLRQFKPDAIVQWEADETRPYCFDDFSNYPDEGISARHNNGPTVGRFDGGAERLPVSDFIACSGALSADLQAAGSGWQRCRIPAPNRLWCSPVHKGVPDDTDESP